MRLSHRRHPPGVHRSNVPRASPLGPRHRGRPKKAPPKLAINVHIDDICTSAVANDDTTVANRLLAGAADILQLVEGELGCKVSEAKAAVVASNWKLQQQLVTKLGRLGGPTLVTSAANLGVDATGGRARATFHKRGTLRARQTNQTTRLNRVRRLAKGHRPTAKKVFQQGILPAVTYGAQVWGMDTNLLQALRTEWLRVANAPGKGKSRSKSLVLHGDPAGTLANAPIATYIDIVWGSVHNKGGMPP